MHLQILNFIARCKTQRHSAFEIEQNKQEIFSLGWSVECFFDRTEQVK